jgi:hypothetical protein
MNSHSTGTLAKGSGVLQEPLRIRRLTFCTDEVREDSSRGSSCAQAQILEMAYQRFNLPFVFLSIDPLIHAQYGIRQYFGRDYYNGDLMLF